MAQPTGNEPDKLPWYNRPIPTFVPAWLLVCLAFGGVCAWLAAYFPRAPANAYAVAALGFGIGFCLGVAGLVCTHLFHREFEPSSGLLPPIWVTGPVTAAWVVALGAFAVHTREFPLVQTRAVQGPVAVILGLLTILVAGCGSSLLIRSRAQRVDRFIAGCAGLCLSLVGLAFSVVRIWQHLHG